MALDKKCECSKKTTVRSEEEKKKLLNRLSRIEGQIRGIKGMVEKDSYCADILTQSAAASSALDSFNSDLLARHLRTCVANELKSGDDSSVDELVKLISKMI